MDDGVVLKPGVSIKPQVDHETVKKILLEMYGLQCRSIKELNGYDDKNFHVIVESTHNNCYIENVIEEGYIFKVINSIDSKKEDFFDAQNKLLLYLGGKGVCCPKPVQNKNGQYFFTNTFPSGPHLVRILEFISGTILHKAPNSNQLFYQAGKYLADLDNVLKDFNHEAYKYYKSLWMMQNIRQLSQFMFAVKDEKRKRLVEEVVRQFCDRVLTTIDSLEKGMIHGDFNEQNILVEKNSSNEWHIKGILDFGDSAFSCYLFEIAIALTYLMIQGKSIDVGGHVLAGYSSVRKISSEDYGLLKVCIAGRLCQSLVLGAYSSQQDPDNAYLLTTSKSGWALLEELWAMPEATLLSQWTSMIENEN